MNTTPGRNKLGFPNTLQDATLEELNDALDIVRQIADGPVWVFMDTKEKVIGDIETEILNRKGNN